MRAWIGEHFPESVLKLLRPTYRGGKRVQRTAESAWERTLFTGHQLGLLELKDIYNESYYARRRKDPWRSDARTVSEAIKDQYNPDSVIDFGCAIGAHLEPFHEAGITAHGVEGNREAFEHAVIPYSNLKQHDLREYCSTGRMYDLVLCFEVAEHLPEESADELVRTLTDAGETVVMTAATPGQTGTHHVNTQPREYWIEKFRERGFDYDNDAVEALRDQMTVERTTWIPENLLVFEGV